MRTFTRSADVTGLSPLTVYIFHVRARTAAGYGDFSAPFEFSTNSGAPTAPGDAAESLTTHSGKSAVEFLRPFPLRSLPAHRRGSELGLSPPVRQRRWNPAADFRSRLHH